jgi:hypothetical protein
MCARNASAVTAWSCYYCEVLPHVYNIILWSPTIHSAVHVVLSTSPKRHNSYGVWCATGIWEIRTPNKEISLYIFWKFTAIPSTKYFQPPRNCCRNRDLKFHEDLKTSICLYTNQYHVVLLVIDYNTCPSCIMPNFIVVKKYVIN